MAKNNSKAILLRQLSVLAYLARNYSIRIADLANHFGVSPLVLVHDIEAMQASGDISLGTNWAQTDFLTFSNTGGTENLLHLNDYEIEFLLTSLNGVLNNTSSVIASSLLEKLKAFSNHNDSKNIAQSEDVKILNNAVSENKVVEFIYHNKPRKVAPLDLRIYQKDGILQYYLHSYDLVENGYRTYICELISDCKITDESIDFLTLFDADISENFYTLIYKQKYALSALNIPFLSYEQLTDGSVAVTIKTTNEEWFDEFLRENAFRLVKVLRA